MDSELGGLRDIVREVARLGRHRGDTWDSGADGDDEDADTAGSCSPDRPRHDHSPLCR